MGEPLVRNRFERGSLNEKTLRMLRLIQIAALLPLTLITALMIYFKEASEFGILAFFFLLVLGVFVPEIKGELILTRIVLKGEVEEIMQQFRAEIEGLLDEREGKKDTMKQGQQSCVSETVNQRSSPSR